MAKKDQEIKVIVEIVRVPNWNAGPLIKMMEEVERLEQEVKEGA